MKEIVALVCYLLIDFGYFDTLFVAIVRAFLLARKPALLSGEFMHGLLQIFGVIDDIAVAVGVKLLYADIDADHAACIWSKPWLEVNIHNHKVFASRSTLHCDIIDMSDFH